LSACPAATSPTAFIDAYDAETGARAWRFYTVRERANEAAYWPSVEVAQRAAA
jgi:hypothetical protein